MLTALIRAEISILAVLADRDKQTICQDGKNRKISILAVLADRDESAGAGGLPFEFQSSRSLRTATKMGKYTVDQIDISILAVLADRDQYTDIDYRMTEISILAVLADRDPDAPKHPDNRRPNFNPRGPCGPRRERP